jgi:large subunit ribosomal protein L23
VDIYQVIREPHITEKGTMLKEGSNQVILKVHKDANKSEIRQAVRRLLKVKVLDVRTINMSGKSRRVGRNVGKRSDWKKAIVRLAPGENVEFFQGV